MNEDYDDDFLDYQDLRFRTLSSPSGTSIRLRLTQMIYTHQYFVVSSPVLTCKGPPRTLPNLTESPYHHHHDTVLRIHATPHTSPHPRIYLLLFHSFIVQISGSRRSIKMCT